jgi:hypothetical protein
MSITKGASLRRQQRHCTQPSVPHGCDAPISLVFRTHNEGLSKAAFLFCPKNFNLGNPVTATTTTTGTGVTTTPGGGAARHGAGVAAAPAHDTSSAKRFAASTSPATSAQATSAESVQNLVEAIIELRPFAATVGYHGGSSSGVSPGTVSITALPPASPVAGSGAHLEQNPTFTSFMVRPASSASLGWGSHVDLMSLSPFASPAPGGSGGAVTNGSFSCSAAVNAGAYRYGEWLHAAASPRTAGPVDSGQALPAPSAAHAGAGSTMGTSLAGVSGGAAVGGGGSGVASPLGGGGAAAPISGSGIGGGGAVSPGCLLHPSGSWICRAMAFNEKEVSHANGAISVNQSLTSKCALINEVAKGKVTARILTSYQEVQERYGLSHVEVTVDNQYVSRSDLFLLSEALRERVLYEGEEIHLCNFRIRIREMLQTVVNAGGRAPSSPAIPIVASTGAAASAGGGASNPASGTGGAATTTGPNTGSAGAAAAAGITGGKTSYVRVGCGVVLPTTRINFQSLSPVHYVVIELSREMWDTTIDGRIALTWAIRKFISELLLKQLPKRKASPLVRVVFTGRLQREFLFGRHSDVFHLLELPREARNVDVVEEIRMHCEAFVDRVLREVQAAARQQLEAEVAAYRDGRPGRGGAAVGGGARSRKNGGLAGGEDGRDGFANESPNAATASAAVPDRDAVLETYMRHRRAYIEGITAKRLFVHAKQSNTLEALSILLERCNHHYIDRHLTLCGHAVTVVSAGKGFYEATNSLVQIVCARLHDMGLEKVHIVCIGRPPLHVTPLLEYTSDDETLRSQYHLHSRVLSSTAAHRSSGVLTSGEVERYYETPEWIAVFFFHPALSNYGGETVFELLPKEYWQREHPMMSTGDMMWTPQGVRASPPQQQQRPFAAGGSSAGRTDKTLLNATHTWSGGAGSGGGDGADCGEEDGHSGTTAVGGGSADRQRGDAEEAAPTVAKRTQGYDPVCGLGPCVGNVDAAHAFTVAASAAANPPLLIPGLGLRSYPVAEVTLPVPSATAAAADLLVDRRRSPFDMSPSDGDPMQVAGTAAAVVTPMRALRAYQCDALEMSATASHGTDHVTSPISPFADHPHMSGLRSVFAGAAGVAAVGGGVSPLFPSGGAASSPFLVRATTTTTSSVFASPNMPGRGSMPRGGAASAVTEGAAMSRKYHRLPLPGLNGSHNTSQPHVAAAAAAFPPVQPSSTLHVPQPRQRGGGGAVVGMRRCETSTSGSLQRRVRGSGAGVSRMPLYVSSSSIAVSVLGPGGGSRYSNPNSLTSYSARSHPPLHISCSLDDKTSANPNYHSLGAFQRSVRSTGSSLVARHDFLAQAQMRSLLPRDGATAKSSSNSIAAHPVAAGGSGAAALHESHAGVGDVEGGPIAVCAWYCLHAAKLHQEGGSGYAVSTGAAGSGFARTLGRSGGGETGSVRLADVTPCEEALLANAAVTTETPGYVGATPSAVLPTAKPWHKPLTCSRTDAVFCGCNVVDSDLRNGYLILEITIDAAVLPGCFWAPRILLDDRGWGELMNCFTGRDDRLTGDADTDSATDEVVDGDDSVMMGGRSSSVGGYAGVAAGAAPSSAPRRTDGLPGRGGDAERPGGATRDGASGARSGDSIGGDIYRFQSDFRAAEVFCRSHSGISADGRTLIIPTHNNSVHFQSSEEVLLRLQPSLFVTAVDEGGGAALGSRDPLSSTTLHHALGAPETEDAVAGGSAGISATERASVVGPHNGCVVPPTPGRDMHDSAADTAAPLLKSADAAPEKPTKVSGNEGTAAAGNGSGAAESRSSPKAEALCNTALAGPSTPRAAVGRTPAAIWPLPLRLPTAPVATSASVFPGDGVHDHSPLHETGVVQTYALSRYVADAPAAVAAALVTGAVITVGFVQLRNSLLFAIKPINPLRPSAEDDTREELTALSQSAESASTATVLRRRWQWKHPDIDSEPPHLASWTRLCTCHLLPLYGSKPAYPREGFYTVSPHQYTVTNPSATGGHADPADEKKRLLEFVLQRLQQQYQIVVDTPGLAAGAQWPRADPSPNARLEMSLGHQTHTLKVGETAKTISVTRMLHRGMYSNGQVTHMLSYRYLLWNYLADEFAQREVHMEAQVGERNAFRWESLDRWLQERPGVYIPRGPDLWLRSREVAVMLLPEDPAHPPSFAEFYRFIGYRFSVHLSTHGKVEWQRHSSGVTLDIPDGTPITFPPAPSLMDVVLVHDNPQTLDTRNVMDRVTGRTIAFEVPVEERYMSVDVSLPKQYDPQCCYFLKVSWLACAASLVVDWFGSFIANASRFRLHAVPMACYYNSPKAESLTAHYDVEAASAEEEPALRRALVELLISPAYRYYPDTPTITRNCRMVHLTGLCCVILPPSPTTVAQWYQNACLRQGSVEQLQLLVQFKEAEALARQRVAALQGTPPV